MGLNSPIELTMTEAGLAAKENAESIIFTRFLAGSTGDSGSTSVTSIKQVIPINNYVKRIAGQEYIQDGVTQVANESFISISGFANSLDAENEYVLNEIALMAKLDENGEEFCFAYDWSNSYKYRIRTDLSQPITVQYKIVLTRVPQLTVNTSETGVTYSDLYSHTEKTVTQTPVHGLKCIDGVLTVNGRALHKSTVGLGNVDNTADLDKPISTATQEALTGLSNRIDGISLNSLGGVTSTDLTTHTSDTSNPHSVTYSQTGAAAASHTHVEADITDLGNYSVTGHTHTESDITDLGSYASNTDLNTYGVSAVSFDNSTSVLTVTMKGGSTKTVTITSAASGSGSGSSGSGESSGGSGNGLSINSVSYDDTTNNIVFTMSDNSEVTCNLDDLLDQCLRYDEPVSGRNYNSEWVDRLTGTGTALDPYLIYTPKDFIKIQDHMDAHYKLMNDLDFTDLTGLSIEISGNSFTISTENSSAPLYNDGEGFYPFGYNGYFPQSGDSVNTTIKQDTYGTFVMVKGDVTSYPSNAFHIFTGELDGNSKVIKGIICSPENTYSVGLFSFIGNGASVHDLTIKDSTFICNEVFIGWGRSSVASVAGSVTFLTYQSDPIHISNVYNYATLISNRDTTDTGSQAKISGICGAVDSTDVPGVVITECTNRGQMIIVDSSKNHRVAGIYYNDFDSASAVTNCINTANLVGYKAYGIGFKIGKVNINCGEMTTQDSNSVDLYPITDQTTASYVDGAQYANIAIQTATGSAFATDNTNNVNYKSVSDLKSQQFISDANTANGTDVFAYNDLNFDSGWPLLIDEYNQLSVPDGNSSSNDSLDFALIDPSSNKVYSSGISLSELNASISGLASASHTHTTTDITDISSLATATGLNTYGVNSMSFDTSTNVLTLTMKDGNTKTVIIPANGGNSGLTVSSISYDSTNERLVFTMSDTSVINCDISSLISALNITYDSLDNRTYNSEWVERMTGSGTVLDPYLIYTPRDFMKINDDMTAHYKLMNNLDFAPVSGLSIEISGDGYEITTTDNTAALYNNGEGFWPIGYDGYFPLNGETRSTSTFAEANWGSEIIYGTNNAALASIFTGELDGNNKIIKGIICSPENTYSVGLFSFLGNGASVHNFTIKDSVFIVNDVYITAQKKSSVASVAGNLIYTTGASRNAVNIYNIYNYATIISNRSTEPSGSTDAVIAGIFGRLNGDSNPGYIVRECANHGELIIVNDSVHHGCSGIGYYKEYSNGDNRIINCINTANLYGFKVFGIGQNIGKININCGNMTKSNEYYGEIWPITDHRSNSYIDGNQFVNITNQSVANSDYTTDGSWNVYYKSATELKSQAFIDEANALLPEPVFAYNDLNVNDGWPLLIDEYNTLIGVNGNLNLSLIDPLNRKLYKSGYSLEKLQKVVTYREMNTEINGQFSQYVSTQLGGLKTITTIVATTDWTAEEESGTPTGNYLATVTASGITASSPVQLMTQLTDLEIEISEISSNSVTLIANSEPQSDIRIGIMFIP